MQQCDFGQQRSFLANFTDDFIRGLCGNQLSACAGGVRVCAFLRICQPYTTQPIQPCAAILRAVGRIDVFRLGVGQSHAGHRVCVCSAISYAVQKCSSALFGLHKAVSLRLKIFHFLFECGNFSIRELCGAGCNVVLNHSQSFINFSYSVHFGYFTSSLLSSLLILILRFNVSRLLFVITPLQKARAAISVSGLAGQLTADTS